MFKFVRVYDQKSNKKRILLPPSYIFYKHLPSSHNPAYAADFKAMPIF